MIPKIDECLEVENGITPHSLREDAGKLLDGDPALAALRGNPTLRAIGVVPQEVAHVAGAQRQPIRQNKNYQ